MNKLKDWQRVFLITGMGIMAWLLVIEWSQFQERNTQESTEIFDSQPDDYQLLESDFQQENISSGDDLPTLDLPTTEIPVVVSNHKTLVTVKNDVLEIVIDTYGGDIVSAKLLKHFDKKEGGKPLSVLRRTTDNTYVARSGIIGPNATDSSAGRPQFFTDNQFYEIDESKDYLNVNLTTNIDGIRIVKRFQLSRNGYGIKVSYLINNNSFSEWNGAFYGQIKRDSKPPFTDGSALGLQPYLGAALRQPEKNYAKFDFSDIDDNSVKTNIKGGWVAMVQHYFISAWVPPSDETNNFTLRKLSDQDIYLMTFTGSPFSVKAGQTGEYEATFYVGPKDQQALGNLAEYLDRTVDYGFLWVLAEPLFKAMKFIHSLIGNWGWTIILLTIGVKIVLYPLSAASLKSMAKMRNLQPEMTRLKELYGEDRQKMSQEMMSLYKKEKVNPAGGCFPMLLQMPVFLSLYWVLMESVEIRHASWVWWIQDLSAKDPYFVLPLLMGGSMLLMQKLQPMPTDPMQAKIMQFMPIGFTFLMLGFPSGLVLYWTINNLLSMAQQWYVNRQLIIRPIS
jgi:YidC/Oxa1 family membrane protein insertase